MTVEPEVFVDLLEATIRSSRNYHRLDHLAQQGSFRFKEETITDLLVGELAGKAYDVSAACPLCLTGSCPDWDGDPQPPVGGIRIRALTKQQEGGNKRTGLPGVHADFILAVGRHDPDPSPGTSWGLELRLLVQAKRAVTTETTFNPNAAQYDALIAAAQRHRAVPYYALYVQQADAHLSTQTRCPRARNATDRSIVLAAAHGTAKAGGLRGQQLGAVLAGARPLRCLVDCRCRPAGANGDVAGTRTRAPDSVWSAVRRFIAEDFSGYEPASTSDPLPPDVPQVLTNVAHYKPRRRRRDSGSAPAARGDTEVNTPATDEVLLIRLGQRRISGAGDERMIGYSSDMSEDDLADAARRYWYLSPVRAARVRYLIASAGGEAVRAYAVPPDGLSVIETGEGRRRVSFTVTSIRGPDVARRLLTLANERLATLTRGAQNPCIYLNQNADE